MSNTKSTPADLRLQIVQEPADLLVLDTNKLAEGARCLVQQNGTDQGREYIFTRKSTGTISFTDGLAAENNVASPAASDGLWVAAIQIFTITINGTTPVVVENLYCSPTAGTPTDARLAWTRNAQGTAPGFLSAIVTDNDVTIVSSSGTDDSVLSVALFPAV